MTAPAPLSNRPAARGPEITPVNAGPMHQATFAGVSPGQLPAPPAPVPPIAPAAQERSAPLALTRPRQPNRVARLAVAVTVTLAVVGGLGWLGQAAEHGVPARTAVIRVGAGETLWDVAQRVAPKSDQRAVVERIRQLNRMADSAVAPGQQLEVPDGRG
ncbi:MAG: LysM peptidoglycan-binding domain-containing protein [Pseudonocardiaceae bacterium]